jgi:hypothetical protein
MKTNLLDIKGLIKEIDSTVAEIEKLQKSEIEPVKEDLAKAEGDEEDKIPGQEDASQPPAQDPAAIAPEAPPAAAPDSIADAAQQAAQASSPEQAEETIESVVKGLSDEELQSLISSIQAEMSSRQAAQAPAQAPAAPAAAPAAPPAVDPNALQMSLVPLQKSIAELTKKMDDLTAENNRLKKSVAPSKPAVMNKKEVQVLSKSEDAAPEMLSKSDCTEYLLNQQRQGNRAVTTNLLQEFTWANTPGELREAYRKAELKGVKLPVKS